MQIKTKACQSTLCMMALLAMMVISCKKAALKQEAATVDGPATEEVAVNAINSAFSENWDSYTHGSTYTSSQAAADFGNVSGWVDSRAMISNGNLRITVLANALSGAGGNIANIDVADGSAYELDFDVRFHSQFDWSRGGKVGFGFLVGDGNTGGDPGWDGNGGSLRMMWYQTDAGRVFFQPYVYYRDQPGDYGDAFGKSYPSSGSLNKGQTYHIHMYIKSNTGSNTNGRAQILVDGNTLLDTSIRWTTNDAKRLVRLVSFHTFRGGSQSYWMSSTDGYIYYDNLVVNRISS